LAEKKAKAAEAMWEAKAAEDKRLAQEAKI